MEEWLPVLGTDGWYEVSSEGRVRSWRMTGRNGVGRKRAQPKILKQRINDDGYALVGIYLGPKPGPRTVHSLVAEAFIGPRPKDLVICHGDGDPSNNRRENLRYGTAKDNAEDRIMHGRAPRGEKNPAAVLNNDSIRAIHALYATGEFSHRDIARAFGVSKVTVGRILQGRLWVAAS